MKFSIIIPAHNAGEHLAKALESVRSQVFTDYELIVVCDSCTDNTQEIAEQYNAIVEVVDYKRDGLTRNKGLEIAQGEWVLFMDADDWWLHEYVLTMLNSVLNGEMDILCFSFIWKNVGYTNQGKNIYPAVWNKAWRRSAIGDTRFRDCEYGSDGFFTTDVFGKTPQGRVRIWDTPFYYYNFMTKGSLTERKEAGEVNDEFAN